MQVSEKTVENHVYPILSVLQVRNRIEAIITVFQNGGMDTPASKKETDTLIHYGTACDDIRFKKRNLYIYTIIFISTML